jgi:hypothetical protein
MMSELKVARRRLFGGFIKDAPVIRYGKERTALPRI